MSIRSSLVRSRLGLAAALGGAGALLPAGASASPFAYIWSNADTTADSDVTVIDLATDQVKTVLEAGNGAINAVAVSPSGEDVFVAQHGGAVFVYRVNELLHTEVFAQDLGSAPTGVVFTPDGNEVYVSHLYGGYVTRLLVADWIVADDPNTSADDVRPAYSFGGIPVGGRHLAMNQWGDEVVVAHDGGELSIVDLISETSVTQINGAPFPGGVALIPGGGLMAVSDPAGNRVRIVAPGGGAVDHAVQEARGLLARYDGQTLKIQIAEAGASRITTLGGFPALTTGSRPFGVAFSPDLGVLVSANFGDDSVSILRAAPAVVAVPDTTSPTGITVGPELPPVAGWRASPVRFTYKVCSEMAVPKLEIVNKGLGVLRVGQVSLAGADARAFTIAKDACADREVAPGGSCAINLRFLPRKDGGKSGVYQAAITAATNDPHARALTATLEARPLAASCGG